MSPRCLTHGRNSRNTFQRCIIGSRSAAFLGDIFVKLLQLSTAYGGLDVGQPIVVADFIVDILNRVVLGLGRQVFRLLGPLLLVSDDHSAAAGGDNLVAIETKAGSYPALYLSAFKQIK